MVCRDAFLGDSLGYTDQTLSVLVVAKGVHYDNCIFQFLVSQVYALWHLEESYALRMVKDQLQAWHLASACYFEP